MVVRSLLLALLLIAPAIAADPEDLPGGLPPAAGKDERRAVLELMKENARKYGGDVALLQGLLLTHSLQGEAVLTTESTIVGVEEFEGQKYVALRVSSGVIFNDRTMTREQRLERIWHVVLERSLLKYPSFTFTAPAAGLEVEILYNHRPYNRPSDLVGDDSGPVERVKVYMLSKDLTEFLAHRIGPREFLGGSKIFLDGKLATVDLREVSMPPRPPPEAANAPTPRRD